MCQGGKKQHCLGYVDRKEKDCKKLTVNDNDEESTLQGCYED